MDSSFEDDVVFKPRPVQTFSTLFPKQPTDQFGSISSRALFSI
jgi:hypothetical protein